MKDLDIIQSLLNGNHLESKELERAFKLIYLLDLKAKRRVL